MGGDCEPIEELSVLTGPVIRTVNEGVSRAVDYYTEHKPTEAMLESRRCMSGAVRKFHEQAHIFDSTTESELEKLSDPNCLVVEIAHQPNIFPYSGFYKKLILGKILGDKLKEQVDAPVVVTFGFVDQDFANPKWFRKTQLPDIHSQEGVLVLKLPVSRRTKKVMYAVPRPDEAQISAWKGVLENWLTNNIRRFNKLIPDNYELLGFNDGYMIDKKISNVIRGNLRKVNELIDESQKLAGTITDFNAFFTALLTYRYWKYPFLFYNYHSVQDCFGTEYQRIIKDGDLVSQYSGIFSESYNKVTGHDITFDFNMPSSDQAPFWYQCECGGKVDVGFGLPGPRYEYEPCPECGTTMPEDLQDAGGIIINERISPRAVFRPLLIANTLRPSIFVSGLAAQGFHMTSRGIAQQQEIPLAPYIFWPGGDNYNSLAKMVAELTRVELGKKNASELTMKEQKLVSNYDNTMSTIPSIIDHLVNIGLLECAAEWEKHLVDTKDLAKTPELTSVFNRIN